MVGQVAELLLGVAAVGDVGEHALHPHRPAVGRAAERALVTDPDGPPVAGDHPVLDRERLERLGAARLLERDPVAIVGVHRFHQKLVLTSHSSAGKPSSASICGET